MTLEEAMDLIYKKKKETRVKIRTIRAKSDFADFDLDKSLLNEYDLYIDYIKEIAPKIRDIELNNIISNIFRIEPIEDWTKGRYSTYQFMNLLHLFDKYKDDTIMTTIIRTRCDNLKNEYKAREF
jgi:hypothetical protein